MLTARILSWQKQENTVRTIYGGIAGVPNVVVKKAKMKGEE